MKKVRSKLRPTEVGVIKTFSLSPDDEVGEIAVECTGCTYYYNNLAELCEKWEDYEEPKEHWTIGHDGAIFKLSEWENQKDHEEIGNYFETEEEAEKAMEKLKAWKRLKDKQFKFYGWNKGSLLKSIPNTIMFACDDTKIWSWEDIRDDLDLLFGGEE